MVIAFVIVAFVLGLALGAWGWSWWQQAVPVAAAPTAPPAVEPITAPPVEAPVARPAAASEHTITIRYVSQQGRVVGEQKIFKSQRRPTRTFQRGYFMASHQASDGAWVYRHCHTERKS